MNRILITPVKNEAHLLGNFLRHHTPLFEHIVICDDGSVDGSADIARSFDKVTLIHADGKTFHEWELRTRLLDQAYALAQDPFVMALDADELLIADGQDWAEWCNGIISTSPGATVTFPWLSPLPGLMKLANCGHKPFARIRCQGTLPEKFMHIDRIPLSSKSIRADKFIVLHLNLLFPRRQQMKTWWYMALEAINRSTPLIDFHRVYIQTGTGFTIPTISMEDRHTKGLGAWLSELAALDSWETWQKEELIGFFEAGNGERLAKIDIWDFPWNIELIARGKGSVKLPDSVDRLFFFWVRTTQMRRHNLFVRLVDYLLRKFQS